MPRTRVHNLIVSLDGFAAGDHVTVDAPIGDAGKLFSWLDGRPIHGIDQAPDDPITADRALTTLWAQGIGAEIMGRRKFGPQTGQWPDDGWRGWWGEEPPFRTPVYVMTHHPRAPIEFPNGTTFHFVDGTPQQVLEQAQEAAGDLDVRLGGGPSTISQFLRDDLVDFLHVVVAPIVLGRGTSPWTGRPEVEDRFTVESFTAPSGLTHQFWNRRRQVG